jgi:hypothetical protein
MWFFRGVSARKGPGTRHRKDTKTQRDRRVCRLARFLAEHVESKAQSVKCKEAAQFDSDKRVKQCKHV